MQQQTPRLSEKPTERRKAVKTKIKTKQKNPECAFFSGAYGTFSRIDHILGHKTNLNKFKSIEIISSIFSDHNDMKLETNHRKKTNEKKKKKKRKSCLATDG